MGFVKDQIYRKPYVIWQTYKKEFMLLSTMSHHRYFITHGSSLNIGWTFPIPLMKALLRFMEHKLWGAMDGISVILVKNHFFILLNKFNLHTIIYVGHVAQAARRWAMGRTAQVRSRVSEGWRFFFVPSCPDWS